LNPGDWNDACLKHFCCATFVPYCGAFLACKQRMQNRSSLAVKYDIKGDKPNGLYVCFCAPCALTQELTEIALHKAATGNAKTTYNPTSGGEGFGGR